ncbi:MAG: RdgB/HAM1 family non-canonical purine NTP pyrophosphatase [Tunicatimonas sp.]
MDICFATNNAHKVQEINQLLGPPFRVLSLADIGCTEELPETQDTLAGNSQQKATFVYQRYGVNCFADDTGLEVDALEGRPGVHSAHYAGPQRSSADNMQLLLRELEGESDRSAQFRTVITLWLNEEMHQFEGAVQGTIATERLGEQGFGYDPIFIPEGHSRSFARMSAAEKNELSHRGRAVRQLVQFLTNHSQHG